MNTTAVRTIGILTESLTADRQANPSHYAMLAISEGAVMLGQRRNAPWPRIGWHTQGSEAPFLRTATLKSRIRPVNASASY